MKINKDKKNWLDVSFLCAFYVNIGKYEMIAQTSYATITYQLNQK